MSDELLNHAIWLINKGQVKEGGEILARLLQYDPKLVQAWAWLYACVKTDEQRIYCLRKVVELDPHHEKAKAALADLEHKSSLQSDKPVPFLSEPASIPVYESSPNFEKKIQPASIQIESSLGESKKGKTMAAPKPSTRPREKQPKRAKKRIKRELPPESPTRLDQEKYSKSQKPSVVINEPGENLFANNIRIPTDFPEIESGMFGYRLVIGDLILTPNDHPDCVEEGHFLKRSSCDVCEFFGYADCPIRHDPDILRDVLSFYAQKERYWVVSDERRQAMLEAVYTELKDHGRPLHYETLARIIRGRYPTLGFTPLKILYLMQRNPEKFECVDNGVYKTK